MFSAKNVDRRKLLVLGPFGGWALVSLSQAAWPGLAWKAYSIWALFAGSSIAAASTLGRRITINILMIFLLTGVGSAFTTAIAYPTIGQTPPFWIGLFSQKNALGWFSAVACLIAAFAPRDIDWRLRVALGFTGLITVWMSKSSTSLGAMLAAGVYGVIIRIVHRLLKGVFARAAALTAIFTTAALSGYAMQSLIVQWFGKDETFSGRTAIWRYYLGLVRQRPVAGWGPGAFTGSPATWRIAADAAAHGVRVVHAHSLYLTTAGEVGWVGLTIYVATLAYLAVYIPSESTRSQAILTAALAVAVLIRGVAEPQEGFNASIGTLALLLSFASRGSGATERLRPHRWSREARA